MDYRDKSDAQLEEDLKILHERLSRRPGEERARWYRQDIDEISAELGRRRLERDRVRLKHVRIQSACAVIAAVAAILGFLTPLGPWLRAAIGRLVGSMTGG